MPLDTSFIDEIWDINRTIEIRPATLDDAKKFSDLMNRNYTHGITPLYFKWQFIDSFYPSQLFVAYDGERLVGCYGVQISCLNNGKKCGFALDLLIDEDYRRRGIPFLLVYELARFAKEKGADFLAALPNKDGMKGHKGFGWRHVGTIRTLMLSPGQAKESRHNAIDQAERKLIYFFRNDMYRNWRYNRNPRFSYGYVQTAPHLFAVTKVFKDPATGRRYGDIIDYSYDTTDKQGLKDLFSNAVQILEKTGVDDITTWALTHTPQRPILEMMGFREMPQERYFCIKILSERCEYMYDFSNWHLVQGDAELY